MADRPQDLINALVQGLSTPLADPFQQEWISVPSLGFRNWLNQELALRLGVDPQNGQADGISANIQMVFPGALRWLILDADRALASKDTTADEQIVDPWRAERMVWTLLEVLSSSSYGLDERLTHLTSAVSLAGRALPISLLFDRYMVHRPQMILDWMAGRNLGPDGKDLLAAQLWQPSLFRAVHTRITEKHKNIATPSERLEVALQRVSSGEINLGDQGQKSLPGRMFVFGQSVISADLGPLLTAVSKNHEVTALLLSPSATTSQQLAQRVSANPPVLARHHTSWAFPRSDPQAELSLTAQQASSAGELHPLLTSWALRPLESALLLGAGDLLPEIVSASNAAAATPTLLNRLQQDLQAGSISPEIYRPSHEDVSVHIHSAPGATRQAEVLRDAILGLLRDNPDLTESQIVILCPQLESFAPVLSAVFGAPAHVGDQPVEGQLPALRYSVIDRSARSFNPVLDSIATMLQILPGRFDVESVSQLLHTSAVKERFGLDGESLGLLSTWIKQACISWGLDGSQRKAWNIDPSHTANSWASGVDQLMMGIALGDDLRDAVPPGTAVTELAEAAGVSSVRKFALAAGGIAPMPLDDAGIYAAGRLAEAVRTLAHVHDQVLPDSSSEKKKSIEDWSEALLSAADLMVAPARFEYWQRSQFDSMLTTLVQESQGGEDSASKVLLTFADVRALLKMGLEGGKSKARMDVGSILVSTPGQLAAVPHRVVCILGLDVDALPGSRTSGDDLIPTAPAVGDRDPRNEARAELLSALLAAQDHLIITCASRDVRTNDKVPESVMLDDLLKVISQTTGQTMQELRSAEASESAQSFSLMTTHTRQAFDPKNFSPVEGEQSVGFDPAACQGAEALLNSRLNTPSSTHIFMTEPLPTDSSVNATVELAELGYFFDAPVKAFFRNRLNVYIPQDSEASASELPTKLGGLDASEVGRALLDLGLTMPAAESIRFVPEEGSPQPQVLALYNSLRARGLLPPDSLAIPALSELSIEVSDLLLSAESLGVRRPAPHAHPIDLTLADGTQIVGSVGNCIDGKQPGPVRILFSNPKPKHQLRLALDLLLLTAIDPTQNWRGVLITRTDPKAKATDEQPSWVVKGATENDRQHNALEAVRKLMEQYRDGLLYPLPLFHQTSFALHQDGNPAEKWGTPGSRFNLLSAECEDQYHLLAFGSLSYQELLVAQFGPYDFKAESTRLWSAISDSIQHESFENADGPIEGHNEGER